VGRGAAAAWLGGMEDGASNRSLALPVKIRRFDHLPNAFSKKLDNHRWAVALHYMHYNFCRVHQTLRVTPAMEAGYTDHVWTIEGVIQLLDARQKAA